MKHPQKQKIKRTGLLQPSGASDLGGREGGRPQLPAAGKNCRKAAMRSVCPVTGSRDMGPPVRLERTALRLQGGGSTS